MEECPQNGMGCTNHHQAVCCCDVSAVECAGKLFHSGCLTRAAQQLPDPNR
jgi:hypothetical protein